MSRAARVASIVELAAAGLLLFAAASGSAAETSLSRSQVSAPPEVIQWIRANAIRLRGSSPALPETELAALAPLLGDAAVIGLGEGTHGTHEFFEFRERLLRWLAGRGELDAILWEAEFANSLKRQQALNDAAVPIEDVQILRSIWFMRENISLQAWLRAHNKRSTTKVPLIGVDASDLPGALAHALDAAGTLADRAQPAIDAMSLALGTPVRDACRDVESCYAAFTAMPEARARLFIEAAAWLADIYERQGASWQAVLAARTVENRARHLLQFFLLAPDLPDPSAPAAQAQTRLNQARAAAQEATKTLEQLLVRDDPSYWASVSAVVQQIAKGEETYGKSLRAADRYAWKETVRGLLARIATGRYGVNSSGRSAELTAAATALSRYLDLLHEGLRAPPTPMDFDNFREVALGTNVAIAARALRRRGRVVFAAHNLHVGYNPADTLARKSSGAYVRDALGSDYLTIGTFFGQGGLRLHDVRRRGDANAQPVNFEIGPPLPDSFEAALLETGIDTFALDLRRVPQHGVVAEWFARERPTRDIGNAYDPRRADGYYQRMVLPRGYDIIVFFRTVTAARPVRG